MRATGNQAEKIWYLRQTGLFDRLSEPDLQRLASLSHMRQYPRGRPILLNTEPNSDLICLVKAGQYRDHAEGNFRCTAEDLFEECALQGAHDGMVERLDAGGRRRSRSGQLAEHVSPL